MRALLAIFLLLLWALSTLAQPVTIQPSPGVSPKTPIRSGTHAQRPTTCVASKEMWNETDATPGQQLFVCNAAGNGFVLVGDGTSGVTSVGTSSPLTGGPITSTGTIGCQTATGGQAGCLAAADFTTFNAKQPPGNYLVDPGSNGLVIRTSLSTTTAFQSPDKKILGNMSGATATATSINPGMLVASNYVFPAQAPGGSLIIGANAVSLTPCPAGVNGADTNHYLYISGGVGTAEAVLLTGGTCTSGATTGTITFVAANTHSGAWTITSATGGIQEAATLVGASGSVWLSNGAYTLYAPVVLPAHTGLVGQSVNGVGIVQAFTTGHAVTVLGGGLNATEISHLSFSASVTVNANFFFVNAVGADVYVHDIDLNGGWGQVLMDNAARGWVRKLGIYNFTRGVQIGGPTGASGIIMSDILGSTTVANSSAFYFRRGLVDLSNFNIQDAGVVTGTGGQIVIAPLAGEAFTESTITNGVIDGSNQAAIYFNPNAAASCFTFTVSNLILTGGANTDHYGIYVKTPCEGIQFSNIRMVGVGSIARPPVLLIGGTSISFNQLNIEDFTVANMSGFVFNASGVATNALSITNSRIGYTSLGAQDNNCVFALNGSGGVNNTDVTLTGNTLFGASTTAVNMPTVFARWNVADNLGLKNVGATVASAATVAFPFMDDGEILTVTGNTGVTAVSQLRAGQTGIILATHAAPGAWTAGATIGNTLTPVQNVPVWWTFDGTKIYLK